MNYPQLLLTLTALSGAIAVSAGAFGAHALKSRLPANLLSAWETAVQYQFIHSLALFGLAILMIKLPSTSKLFTATGICWLMGMLLFSGSLYWLALAGPRWLGPVTPLGGALLIAGWLFLAAASVQMRL